MVTMPIHKTMNLKPFMILLMVIIAVLFLAISRPSQHAIQNHGGNAWSVTSRFKQIDPDDDDTWSSVCPDGRVYTIRQLPDGNAWDVSIDGIDGGNVTRFTSTSKDWVARKLAWCR